MYNETLIKYMCKILSLKRAEIQKHGKQLRGFLILLLDGDGQSIICLGSKEVLSNKIQYESIQELKL